MKDVSKNIPVIFEKLEEFQAQDTRFIKVKIWLMHLGENLNGSYFSKESVTKAMPSLSNTPILCYIEPNSKGEDDFSNHRSRLTRKENGDLDWEYMGQAIGVIPETNNAKFEYRTSEDNIEREYLTCEGLVWTKWDKPIEIFNRDATKAESMELDEHFTGYWEEKDGLFHFDNFRFFGACALGFDTLPAMTGSTIEPQFSFVDFKQEMQKMMEEYKSYCKGGQKLEEKIVLLEKYSITKEQLSEKGIDFETIELSELETKLEEMFSNQDLDKIEETVVKTVEEEVVVEETVEKVVIEKFMRTFELSHDDIRTKLYSLIKSEDKYFWISEVFETYFIYEDYDNSQYYKQGYSIVNEEISLIGEKVEIFATYLTQEELDSLEQEKQKYTLLSQEVEALKEFKATKIAEERAESESELFSQFDEQLDGVEEYTELKTKSSEYSLEDLEVKCYAVLGKHMAKFSKKANKNDKNVKFSFDTSNKEEIPKNSKPYYDIIKKYTK